MTDREPVAQMLNSMLTTLNDIAFMASIPSLVDEVVTEEKTLGLIRSRVELILRFIDETKPVPNKVRRTS